MSLPPINYSVPPPQLNLPPPAIPDQPTLISGPPPAIPGPPSALTGPPPAISGPPPALTGPPPALTGPPPALTGPPPAISGPPPALTGPPPALTGPPPALTGPPPALPGPPPALPGPPPALPVPSPASAVPSPMLTGPSSIISGPTPVVPPPLPTVPPPLSDIPPPPTSVPLLHSFAVPPPPLPLALPPLNQPPPVLVPLHIPPPNINPYSTNCIDFQNTPPPFIVPPPTTDLKFRDSCDKNRKPESRDNRSPEGSRSSREKHRVSPSRHRSYERDRRHSDHRSRSPSYKHRSHSPVDPKERERYLREKEEYIKAHERKKREYRRLKEIERREYEMRHHYARSRSPSHHRDSSSHRRSIHIERHHKSPSRYSHRSSSHQSQRSHSRRSDHSQSQHRCRSPSRSRHPATRTQHSPGKRSLRSPSRDSHKGSRSHSRAVSPRARRDTEPKKPLSDREKILEEYRKNYCQTSDDLIEKIEQWSKEHQSDDDETTKMWYRSSPAELYYKQVKEGSGVQQTLKLQKLCETFHQDLIERGRKARPAVDELRPLKPPKAKMCKHNDKSSSSSSSSDDDNYIDEDGLQGYTDRIMLELQRKQSHPRRLHPEMWFNNTGEMNGGPLCRCSARARRLGMRHGVYAGEETFPRCVTTQSNIDKLYHYRITVSPPTNFLIKAPTIIGHDEHEFLFSGFSMFSHYKLKKLPTCKVIRFNIEYTILYVEEPAPQNFTIHELDLFEEFLFTELLELIDLDLGKATETTCSQFHFMPRFVRFLPEGGCEVLSMCEILKYLHKESGLLISPEMLQEVHDMDHYTWQKFIDRIKGMIITYPGKKPCSVRVDQLDRSPPVDPKNPKTAKELKSYYPEIVHFGIRPPQLSYAGNPEYQKAWRFYVKYRHLIANMAKPSYKDRRTLSTKEANLQEMRTQSKMKRDVTVAISSEGFHTTGLMCDVVQHAMLIPVLVRHLRFHKSLDSLEREIGYTFRRRSLLQTALTHPSYRENFGTNPDHARNSLTNCGIRQPEYGDRRIHYTRKKELPSVVSKHAQIILAKCGMRQSEYDDRKIRYTRKKGIVTLINIMSRFGKHSETQSDIKHNERLEFLGDAVVEFLSSIHLFKMFPGLAEGGLATYRAAIVQNQHLAQLAKNIGLEKYMLYAHGSDLCRDVVMRHAMANCFEALMGALLLDGGGGSGGSGSGGGSGGSGSGLGVEVADKVFSLALWHGEPQLLDVWSKERLHPLQEQEPLGDRKYIKDFEFLQRLTEFEDSIGVQFKHIRLLARSFTDRSVGFTHLTLGSNQRLEFLGDTVLQLVVSDRLYRYFPDHHEGHLSLLRSSLVNNRTQSMVCDDLNMSEYAIYNNPKAKPTTKKHKADLLEAFLGALYIDKNLDYCQAFCNACLFPRLQEFIMNQDWNDPKSKLQQCCLTLRSMEGGEPDIPLYKVIECLGPTNTRIYTVAVYFRGVRLAAARGHSIQEAEMNAAEEALNSANKLFPQLDHQKRVIAKSMKNKKRKGRAARFRREDRMRDDRVPKAYRNNKQSESSSDESTNQVSEDETEKSDKSDDKSDDDSGLDSDTPSTQDKFENVKVSSWVSDMEKIKEDLIRRNEYDKLKEKCMKSDSDSD